MSERDSAILHDKDDGAFRPGRLYSMLDLLGASITCDFCGRWQRLDALDSATAMKNAEQKGWTKRDDKDCCRICTPTPNTGGK